jgi:hypothetical protein
MTRQCLSRVNAVWTAAVITVAHCLVSIGISTMYFYGYISNQQNCFNDTKYFENKLPEVYLSLRHYQMLSYGKICSWDESGNKEKKVETKKFFKNPEVWF